VRAGARFQADQAGRKLGDQCRQLVTHNLGFDQNRFAVLIHTVNRKDVLGEINTDGHPTGITSGIMLMDFPFRGFKWTTSTSPFCTPVPCGFTSAPSGRGSPFHSLELSMVKVLLTFFVILPAFAIAQDKLTPSEMAENARAMARLEGEIQRSVEEHNKRPWRVEARRGMPGEVIEDYIQSIRQKLERVGTQNYPVEAVEKIYGTATIRYEIHSDGSLRNAVVVQSSGYELLDIAAKKTIDLASPGSPFPSAIRERADILVVTEKFNFTKSSSQQ